MIIPTKEKRFFRESLKEFKKSEYPIIKFESNLGKGSRKVYGYKKDIRAGGSYNPAKKLIRIDFSRADWRRNYFHELGHHKDNVRGITGVNLNSRRVSKRDISKAERFAWNYASKKIKRYIRKFRS